MWLALSGAFRARWSEQIHQEWKSNLLENRPDLKSEQLDRTIQLMNDAVPDSIVTGHESLIENLTLPDPNDRHVLAAAIRCGASVIVTFNETDFPASALEPFGIEAQHPDQFAEYLFDLDPAAVVAAAQRQRSKLRSPPINVEQFLNTILKQGLVQTAKSLAKYRAIL
jgi:predicted nucleic acid-binding protein